MKEFSFIVAAGNPVKKLQLAKEEVLSRDGYMGGDSFRVGKYAGRYRHIPGGFEITITDKPFLVPGSMVEKKVREFFA